MTVTGMIVLIGIVAAVLGGAFYGLAVAGNKRKSQAGPHNNWRQSRKINSDTSENSSSGASSNFDCSGGVGGGGD